MTYYVVELNADGLIENHNSVLGPYVVRPKLSSEPHALVIEIADGGTVKYSGPRTVKCSAPSRVTVHGDARVDG